MTSVIVFLEPLFASRTFVSLDSVLASFTNVTPGTAEGTSDSPFSLGKFKGV
jgi:hypothetical protein